MTAGTLAQALESSAVGYDELHDNYEPVLSLMRELLGVYPNHCFYLEIWPIGFRSVGLMVPNLLNLPASLLGQGAPKDLVGLAMYVSSQSAGCMYCTAHSCTFALRRGASADAVTGHHNAAEAAVASVAESLGRVPSDLTETQVRELEKHLSPDDAEWIVLAIAMMGFLNKFMDAMGIELEGGAIADVQDLIGPTGWTAGKHQWDESFEIETTEVVPEDSLRTYLRVFRRAPGAIRIENQWTKGMSGRIGHALNTLEDHVGYAFPIFGSLRHKRAVKAIATILRDNLDESKSRVGLSAKCLVGVVFAKFAESEMLLAEVLQLTQSLCPDLDPDLLVDVGHFAIAQHEGVSVPEGMGRVQAAAVMLAKVASTSPSNVNEITIETVTEQLDAEQIVEIVVWLSVLQMLHRLYSYYDARIGLT